MKTFNEKLDDALSEGLRNVHIDKDIPVQNKIRYPQAPQGFLDQPIGFSKETKAGYTAPLFYSQLSDKLTRQTKYHINIFVYGRFPYAVYKAQMQPGGEIAELSRLSGVPLESMEDAINLVITGDNSQLALSPWYVLHQVGEGIVGQIDRFEVLDRAGSQEAVRLWGHDWPHRIFAMRSARIGKMVDVLQELITEYLWHGCRIRRRYPEDANRADVDKVVDRCEQVIDDLLQQCIGKVIYNARA